MKKTIHCLILILALNVISSADVFSANEYFRSIATGNWNSTSTWEMSLNNSTWVPATTTPDATSNLITVRYPNVVTVTANVNADQFTIDSGTVSINTGITLTLLDGSSTDFTILKGGTVTGSGTFQTQGAVIVMNIRDGSNFNALLKVNTGSATARDFSSPNTGKLYGAVIIDSGGVLNTGNTSGTGTWFYGNIINNGRLTASSTGGFIRIKGASLVNNGAVDPVGTIYFDTTTNLSGNGSFTPNITVVSGNVTLLSNITYSPSSYITMAAGAVLNPNGYTFTLTSGDMGLDVGAEISFPGNIRTQNTVRFDIRPGSEFNANLVVNTGTAFAYSFASPYDGSVFGNVTIDAGATLNTGNVSGRHLFIYGSIVNNGTLTASSTGGSYSINGPSLVNNGTMTCAGTVYFDSTTSISGSGLFTPSVTLVSGNFTMLSNITYSPSSYISMSSGGVLNPNGNTFTLTSGDMGLDVGAEISSPGTIRAQNAVRFDIRAGSAFNANLNVNTGTADAYSFASPFDGSVYGNVTIDAGAILNCGNTSGKSLSMFGNVINNGTLTTTSTGGSIRLKGSSIVNNGTVNPAGSLFFDTTTSISGTGNFTSYANFSGNANVTLNSNHQMHGITLNSNSIFNISNRLLKFTASNPITQNGTFTNTNSTIEYNGTALQSISTANINYQKLRINNAANTTLPANLTVNDTLSVVLGDLNITSWILTLGPNAYLTETSGNTVFATTGYVTTTRNLNAPSALNVGGMGAVLTTAVNLGSTEIRRGNAVQSGLNGGTSIARFFDIMPTVNDGLDASMTFKYDDSELNGKPEASLKLFYSTNTGSSWILAGGTPNPGANSISVSKINSFSRWSADTSSVSMVLNFVMEGFYNPVSNTLNMKDTVRAYFRNTNSPYNIVDSAKSTVDPVTFSAAYNFVNAVNGTYYIQTKHRNSIETWSRSGGEAYSVGNTLKYNFTSSATKAFGNNQIMVDASPVRYGVYAADVNQDGTVDLTDGSLIDNGAANFVTGYVLTDANGDSIVDLADAVFADNNGLNFVGKITP